jgi:hypothetical protein
LSQRRHRPEFLAQLKGALQERRFGRFLPAAILALAGLAIIHPLWVALRPPIQDLPQHVAAVRVLTSYFDPSYRLKEYFELQLGKTQYLTVYLLAVPLAKVVGPIVATKAVLSLALVATPLAILRLLRALRADPWLACFSLPFVFNVHVAFGFLNFVAAIPLMFVGLSLAVEQRHAPAWRGQLWLALVLLACFFTHVVPFGLLGIAVVALTRWERRAISHQALVLLPSAVAAGLWLIASPAGRVVSSLGQTEGANALPASHIALSAALGSLPDWVIHITTSEHENLRLVILMITALCLLVLVAAMPAPAFAQRDVQADAPLGGQADARAADKLEVVPARGPLGDQADARVAASGRDEFTSFGRVVVLLLMPLSMVAYFALPSGYGFIWPICQRFPILAILLGIPAFARAPRWALRAAQALSLWLALAAASEQTELYREGGNRGYRGFDEVVEQIPKGSRVVTLVFSRQLEGLQLTPLMHAAGWVQAERGGVSTFSFAEFPSSPFGYRPELRPPRIPPRWEWRPDLVVPDRDLGWYEYCLVRGWSGSLEQSRRFIEVARNDQWSLWRRTNLAAASSSPN